MNKKQDSNHVRAAFIVIALLVGFLLLYLAQQADRMVFSQDANLMDEVIVSYILPGYGGYEQSLIKEGANAAAREWQVSVLFEAAESQLDVGKQSEAIQQAIRNQVNAIVLLPGNYQALRNDVQQAAHAGIPVIIADRNVSDEPVVCSIYTDSEEAAKNLGSKIVERFPQGGDYLLLGSNAAGDRYQSRQNGLLTALKREDSLFHMRDCFDPEENANEAMLYVKKIFDTEAIDFIVALDGISAQGAAQALRENNASIPLFAYDCIPTVIDAVDDGLVAVMVMENSFSIGYLSVTYAVKAARGKEVPKEKRSEYRLITPENLYDSENMKLAFPFNK